MSTNGPNEHFGPAEDFLHLDSAIQSPEGFEWYVPKDRQSELWNCVDIVYGCTSGKQFYVIGKQDISPTIILGPEAFIMTYKGKINASLFFKRDGDRLIVTQTMGEKGMKVGHIFDYRKVLLNVAKACAIDRGCKELVILGHDNIPYAFFGIDGNNYKNSTALARRYGLAMNEEGNFALSLEPTPKVSDDSTLSETREEVVRLTSDALSSS